MSYAFEQHFIGDECDKFAVGRFFVMVVDAHAEQRIDVFDFAAIPSDFDRVTDGALHFARTCIEMFGNFRI